MLLYGMLLRKDVRVAHKFPENERNECVKIFEREARVPISFLR